MVELTQIKVFNLEAAFRGMRQPFKNTNKTDSVFGFCSEEAFYSDVVPNFTDENFFIDNDKSYEHINDYYYNNGVVDYLYSENDSAEFIEYALIGPNDLELAQRLAKAGSPHNKFLRQILVSFDINAPLYW